MRPVFISLGAEKTVFSVTQPFFEFFHRYIQITAAGRKFPAAVFIDPYFRTRLIFAEMLSFILQMGFPFYRACLSAG